MDTIISSSPRFSFSIDREGTFTYIYYEINFGGGTIKANVMKLFSVDPFNYADEPTDGIRSVLSLYLEKEIPRTEKIPNGQIKNIRVGKTVATNAPCWRAREIAWQY